MKTHNNRIVTLIFLSLLLLAMMSCSRTTSPGGGKATPTPTPTAINSPTGEKTKTVTPAAPGLLTPEITLTPSPCKGLSGELEVEVLVGPAAAVGMPPFSIGVIPFTVSSQEPYTMQGKTHLSYNKTVYIGPNSYTVTLELDAVLTGECGVDNGINSLNMAVTLSGEQNIVAVIELVPHTFPWKGTTTINASLPIQDGATANGEVWIFILHLK